MSNCVGIFRTPWALATVLAAVMAAMVAVPAWAQDEPAPAAAAAEAVPAEAAPAEEAAPTYDVPDLEMVSFSIDNLILVICAVLVIFMQAGFALVEAGLTRAKSVANIMMKNMMDFCAGAIAFFAVGYAFAFGAGNDFIGWNGWFLGDGAFQYGTLTVPVTFVFQVAFAAN